MPPALPPTYTSIRTHPAGDLARCRTCAYRDGRKCRSKPPISMAIKDKPTTKFPLIQLDDWCGDWEQDSRGDESYITKVYSTNAKA